MSEQTKLEKEIAKLEKDYGKGSIISPAKPEKIEVISTGSLKLDLATGIMGLPRGGIVEFLGWESSGKSTIVQTVVGNAQKQGLKCLYIDGEYSLDTKYAKALGVDMDSLLIHQLDQGGGEKCYNIAERLIRTGELGVVVIDSQTSMLPKKVMEGETGDAAVGLHARMMGQAVPKIANAAATTNTLVIFVSQFREKIGVMFGSPETTNGGHALKFYSHMRIDVRKSVEKVDDIAVANTTRCKVIKNKDAPPFGTAEFRIVFGEGIDRTSEILDLAIEHEIIKQGGAWYTYGESKFQGQATVLQLLKDNPELAREIEGKVLLKLRP